MLTQCLDYFDYVSSGVETYARMYSKYNIDPAQPVRILLIAPSFSQTLLNRCKWIDAKISLFIYSCLQFETMKERVPVFLEQSIPSVQEIPVVHEKSAILSYITDPVIQIRAESVITWILTNWQGRSSADPTAEDISLKVDNRVVAYLCPRRRHFVIYTYNNENHWSPYPIHNEEDFDVPKRLIEEYIKRKCG